MADLKQKAFITNRNPNPAAIIFLIHRSKTVTKTGTKVPTLDRFCQLMFAIEMIMGKRMSNFLAAGSGLLY